MSTHVLFVCTGNICRSPFAEYYARALWADKGVTISSAGTHALVGHTASSLMAEVGAAHGLDLAPHRAQSLESANPPDLVLCMERHHTEAASRAFPGLPEGAIRLLVDTGIADPYGRPMDAYERSAGIITRGVDGIHLPDVK